MQKHYLQDMLEPVIDNLGYETVRILTIGQVNPTLQVMIDVKDGSRDVTVDDCAKVSRALSAVLDEKDPIKDKYSLEVSSPGLDRPLTKPEHFSRFVGYTAKVETLNEVDKRKIDLKEPIKELGTKTVDIKLYEGVIAHLKVDVIGVSK